MGNYYETFDPPFVLTREGPKLPDYQRVYAFETNAHAADERLTQDVWKRLSVLAQVVPLDEIDVVVERGFVTLKGEVADDKTKDAVGRFVDNTIGVRGVDNQLATIGRS